MFCFILKASLEKLNLVANVKYTGKKFIFDQNQDFVDGQSIDELSGYFMSDLYFSGSYNAMSFKIGLKNLFDYKDPSRLLPSDILNNYDPGKRAFVELNLNLGPNRND